MSRDNLAALERLQTIDLQIEGLRKDADEVPARLSELEAAVATARAAADAERGRLADRERARLKVENTLADDRARAKKWEERLPQLKHPREFAALQREVDGLKRTIEDNEELVGRNREDETNIKATVQAREAELAAREAALSEATVTLRARESELQGQMGELEQLRAAAQEGVEPRLLATYNLVRRRRPGPALVEARKGSCTGCNRRLQAQTFNTLLNGEVAQCPSCGRLVYAAPDA